MRLISLAFAGTLALGLAGCNSASEQAVLNGISNNCTSAVAGTAVLVTISSSLAGAAPVATISNVVGGNAAGICAAIETAAQGAISAINAAGGTATVDVTTTTPSGKVSGRYRLKVAPGGTVRYVVPPSPLSGVADLLPSF